MHFFCLKSLFGVYFAWTHMSLPNNICGKNVPEAIKFCLKVVKPVKLCEFKQSDSGIYDTLIIESENNLKFKMFWLKKKVIIYFLQLWKTYNYNYISAKEYWKKFFHIKE